jgi:hypothetical protein
LLWLDDHLERPGAGRVPENLVGIEDAVEREAVSDQQLRVDPMRVQNVEQREPSSPTSLLL